MWADLPNQESEALFATFQSWARGDQIASARKQAIANQARSLGSHTGRRGGSPSPRSSAFGITLSFSRRSKKGGGSDNKENCDCPGEERGMRRDSRFVRIVYRQGAQLELSPFVYFLQVERDQWWQYQRVFEFSLGSAGVPKQSLDEIENEVQGATDLIVLSDCPVEKRRSSAVKRVFESLANENEEGRVLEWHFLKGSCPLWRLPDQEVGLKARWVPLKENGKMRFAQFEFLQFHKLEFLEEVLQ